MFFFLHIDGSQIKKSSWLVKEMCRDGPNLSFKQLKLDLEIPLPRRFMSKWNQLADRAEHLRKCVRIALVGKYTALSDSYASVIKVVRLIF